MKPTQNEVTYPTKVLYSASGTAGQGPGRTGQQPGNQNDILAQEKLIKHKTGAPTKKMSAAMVRRPGENSDVPAGKDGDA